MDDKLTAKTAKFTSLENLYVYGIFKDLLFEGHPNPWLWFGYNVYIKLI